MSCTCGRSPTGKCVGWHKLSEEEYQEKKLFGKLNKKLKKMRPDHDTPGWIPWSIS